MIERPQTPCIKVCVLADGDRCVGCLRTIDEIAAWPSMSAEAQWALIRVLEQRRIKVAEDVVSRIKTHIGTSPAVLFMKGTPDFPQCGFSGQVVQILDYLGVDYKGVNVLTSNELRQGIKEFSNWPTIPQLYVKGEFVGGCDIIREMFQNNELQSLLAEKGVAVKQGA